MAKLTHEFYDRDTLQVAQELLGKYLIRDLDGELLVGRITETEAYIGRCDKACHAYGGRRTERTAALYMAPGHAYIYQIYGMHHCLNFVTEPEGVAAAVLLRAIEPVVGIETMWHLRYGNSPATPYRRRNFMNGPGKVCKGLSLDKAQNKTDLEGSLLFLCDDPDDVGLVLPPPPKYRLCRGTRIGVDYAEEAKDFLWRFWLEEE